MPEIVVSPTRLPTPEEEVGSSVSVRTGEDIEQRQNRNLTDVLRDLPGLNLNQTGGPGGFSQMFIRGANPNHTKVLIDGVPVNDPSDQNGVFDFGPVLSNDIERVEVLRGPQSGLYGSDAIGGVVNIITKKGSGPLRLQGTVEGGSFNTFNQFGSASGSLDRFNYAFNVGHSRVGATPVTPLDLLPPDRARIDDNYENTTFSTKLGADITENFGLNFTARYAMTHLGTTSDDFSVFPSVPAASQTHSDTRQFATRGEGWLKLFDGFFEQRLGVAYLDDRNRFQGSDTATGPAEPTFARGDRVKVDWLGTLHLAATQTLLLGAEQEKEELRDSPVSANNTNHGGFVELQSAFFDRLFTSAALRVDDNDRFGSEFTYRFAPAYLIRETDTKLKGSVGTGFKAPSLTQLFVDFPAFNFFANPNLKPERSLGWDAGFEQGVLQKRVTFGATYFHNDIDNLIVTNAAGTSLENKQSVTTYGIESFVATKPLDQLLLRADYTYTRAEDTQLGEELLRRPRHKASLTAAWQATDRTTLSASALYLGARVDGNRDFSIPRLEASSYPLLNIAGSYALTEQLTGFARIDNLLDRRYEDPTGFQRPGLGIFVGIRVALDTADRGK